MRRRAFLTFAGGALAAPFARAQPGTRTYRVAVILIQSPLAEMTGQDPVHPTVSYRSVMVLASQRQAPLSV